MDPLIAPPCGLLTHLFRCGQLVPFLGAGASLVDPAAPSARKLAARLFAALLPGAVPDVDVSLPEIASYFEVMAGRERLEEELIEVFSKVRSPGRLHHFLAAQPVPLLIVTTNYDCLIEQAFIVQGRSFHLVMPDIGLRGAAESFLWWPPDTDQSTVLSPRSLPSDDIPIILKLHGGFGPDHEWHHSVITEDDNFEMSGRVYSGSLPLTSRFQARSLLFLGYSVRDVHVRHLIASVKHLSQERRFIVNKGIGPMDVLRFRRLGCSCYDLTINELVDEIERISAQFRT